MAASAATSITCKVVIVGDGAVGKTSLLWRWARKEFKPEHEPTVFENYSTQVELESQAGEKQVLKLTLWDTAGQEQFDKLRKLSYPGTNVFLVCFSVDNVGSHESVRSLWYPEIKQWADNATVILVGTKLDLREPGSGVSEEEGNALKQEIRAARYRECSAKEDVNSVKAVFDEAIRCFLLQGQGGPSGGGAAAPKPAKKKGCTIL